MIDIKEILNFIAEDKHTNFTTTSDKFKVDIWNFFSDEKFKSKVCLELGTHKGQTTRILSYLFDKVITVNKTEESLQSAKELNVDRSNIVYIPFDLYETELETMITDEELSVVFVDAGHQTNQVVMDIERIRRHKLDVETYLIFDDFGMHDPVYTAITRYMVAEIIEYVTDIGHNMGYNFGGIPPRILKNGAEGIICKIVNGDKDE